MNRESKFVSVVAYIHNDSSRIVSFLDTILPVIAGRFEKYEIICVDDASTDDSVKQLEAYFSQVDSAQMTQIVKMSYFQGIEAAMNAGRDLSIGDFVYEFDDINADYPESLVTDVYQKLLSGYDIVAASCKGHMKFTSKLFYALYNRTNKAATDIGQETFRLLSRRAINRVKSMGQYIPYRKAVYHNCGLKTTTLFYNSTCGSSRLHAKAVGAERSDLAIDSFIYFTNALETVSLTISCIFLLITMVVLVYIVSSIFSPDKPVEGWLSMMGFMALGFFGVFLLLTLILKYLSVLLNLIFKKQRYLVESIEKIHDN